MLMRYLLSLIAAFTFSSILSAQTINTQDSAWIRDNYVKIEKMIPMRDGVKLFTSIYMPKNESVKHPILFSRTPYSCAPYGENNWRPFWEGYFRYYMRKGYVIVSQDVRGRYMSEGQFVDIRPFNKERKSGNEIDESTDTYDAIDWLVKNVPANNGNVGVMGISYPGFYSTMAAASGHPALKAVSPQAPVTDWFQGDDFHHNGAFMLMDCFSFYAGGFGVPRPVPVTRYAPTGLALTENDNYKTYLSVGALTNFMKLTGDTISFLKEVFAHPNYDDWWKARNARTAMFNIKPAMLVVGGLFDAEDCFGAWNLYKAIEKQSPSTNNKLVMGPWYHGQWSSSSGGASLGNVKFGSRTSEYYQNNIEMPFFDYYLKGEGADPNLAEATIFFSGENKWKKFDQWPPKGSTMQPLYLQSDGKLGFTKPTNTAGSSAYVSDPAHPVPYTEDVHYSRTREYMTDDQRFAERRPDVLTFVTDALSDSLTLAGPLVANLITSISTTDADFVVKLIDVFPDDFKYPEDVAQASRTAPSKVPMGGYEMLVRGEIMRGKFRNSFENPVPFTPNKQTTVRFTLPDVAHTFKAGHKIMVQVQSSWFPLADRNPQQFMNIYTATNKDFRKATINIMHNASSASFIELPVLH
jgi:uncharacterized protein